MKLIVYLALMLTTPSWAFANSALDTCKQQNRNWFACQKDSDCVIIRNPCGWPSEAANRKDAALANACHQRIGAAISCPSYADSRDGKFMAICQKSFCSAKKIDK